MPLDMSKIPSREELLSFIVAMPLKRKLLVLLVIVGTLVGCFYYFSIDSEYTKIDQSRKQLADLEKQRLEKQAIANNLAKFRREVERLNQDLKDAVTLLPNEAEIPELLQKVSELVEKSGLQMDVFELQGESPQGFYAKVPVNMEVTGSFHEVVVFLDKLSKLSRIVNVTNISLVEPVLKNQKIMLKTKFLATTFRFIDTKSGQAKK